MRSVLIVGLVVGFLAGCGSETSIENKSETNKKEEKLTEDIIQKSSPNTLDDEEFYVSMDSQKTMGASKLTLVVLCPKNRPELIIDWNVPTHPVTGVTMSIDGSENDFRDWIVSPDGSKTQYPENTRKLLERMLRSKKFVVATTSIHEKSMLGEFDMHELKIAIDPVKNKCQW